MIWKICTRCKINKSLDDFHNYKKTKDWKEYMCRVCRSEHDRKYRERRRLYSIFLSQEKKSIYNKKYRKSEKGKVRRKEYQQNNRDKIRKQSLIRMKNNRDKTSIYLKKYREKIKENPEKYREYLDKKIYIRNVNRRIKEKSNSDWTIKPSSIKKLLIDQWYKCAKCWIYMKWIKKNWRNIYELDHIIPIAKWWPHSIYNVQWLCNTCNVFKSDKLNGF